MDTDFSRGHAYETHLSRKACFAPYKFAKFSRLLIPLIPTLYVEMVSSDSNREPLACRRYDVQVNCQHL